MLWSSRGGVMGFTRREWLSGATAGAVLFHGPPTLGGLDLGASRDDELEGMFDRLDERIELFREATMPPRVTAWLSARGQPADTLHTMFAGLLTTSLVRDLPERHQLKKVVQQRLHARLAEMGAAAMRLKTILAAAGPEERRRVGRRFAEDPGLSQRLKHVMEPWFGPDLVEPQRQAQIEHAMDSLVWELVHGDPVAVFDEQVEKMNRYERMADHALARKPIVSTPARRRAAAEEGLESGGGSASEAANSMACQLALEQTEVPGYAVPDGMRRRDWRLAQYRAAEQACRLPDGTYDKRYKAHKLRWAARRCAMVGGILCGLGIVTLPVYVGICILTPAVLLLLTALLLLVASAAA